MDLLRRLGRKRTSPNVPPKEENKLVVIKPEDDIYRLLVPSMEKAAETNDVMTAKCNEYALEALQKHTCRTVLDVGCGLGRFVRILLENGLDAYGTEVSPSMLKAARREVCRVGVTGASKRVRNAARGTSFSAMSQFVIQHQYSGAQLSKREISHYLTQWRGFDAVHCALVLSELSHAQLDGLWANIIELVKPGGLLIVRDFIDPEAPTCFGRVMRRIIDNDKASFRVVSESHYENFERFMREGGIEGTVAMREDASNLARLGEKDFLFGNLRTIVLQRKPI